MAPRRTTAQRLIPPSVPDRAGRRPVWGRGSDGHPGGGKAENEDRQTRERYGRPRLRSPYLSSIDIPESVSAGDRVTATAIWLRIDATLALAGKWTKPERARLRVLRKKWARRAAGLDVLFNLRGWQQVTPAPNSDPAFDRDARFARQLTELWRIVEW